MFILVDMHKGYILNLSHNLEEKTVEKCTPWILSYQESQSAISYKRKKISCNDMCDLPAAIRASDGWGCSTLLILLGSFQLLIQFCTLILHFPIILEMGIPPRDVLSLLANTERREGWVPYSEETIASMTKNIIPTNKKNEPTSWLMIADSYNLLSLAKLDLLVEIRWNFQTGKIWSLAG